MIRHIHYISALVWIFFWAIAQNLGAQTSEISSSDRYTVSLITCGPGTELYSLFGHSALRVEDQFTQQDLVFNYGLFSFREPGFMWKFLRGKLLYHLGVQDWSAFLSDYQRDGRSVISQRLRLSPEEEAQLVDYLKINLRPENRSYLYDFYYDNCSTRIRDLVDQLDLALPPEQTSDPGMSYRASLDLYTCPEHSWTDFGMDLILGLPTDRPVSYYGLMYLPDYLSRHLAAYIKGDGSLLLDASHIIYEPPDADSSSSPWNIPLILCCVLAVIIIGSRYISRKPRRWMDYLICLVLGVAGCIIGFMSFCTDHEACQQNALFLYLNPGYFLLAYGLLRGRYQWLRYAAVWIAVAVMLVWILGQGVPIGIQILLGSIALRWWLRQDSPADRDRVGA